MTTQAVAVRHLHQILIQHPPPVTTVGLMILIVLRVQVVPVPVAAQVQVVRDIRRKNNAHVKVVAVQAVVAPHHQIKTFNHSFY